MNGIARLQTALTDRYRIERELGAGGMAVVYLAHDVRHDRKVALKVLRAELSAILGAERFLKEIRTTANLQHPHILPLHDSGEADGVVYYVMPYVEGESLRDRLAREKQLPVDDAVRIGREVASALDYAHRHNVVHRDIKPENILLHDGQALVADFGIALAAARTDGASRLTETGMSLGTPQYMAPEQAMGEREITPKADIYALGCVVYEMLAGEPPFTGPTAQAIIARVMTEQPRSLTLQRHTIPRHLEAAVSTALEKLPADRFASAAQLGEALAGHGPAVPVTRAQPATARPPELLRRPAVVVGVAALALVGALVGRLAAPRPVPAPPLRLAFTIPAEQRLSAQPFGIIALSPDGTSLAYIADAPGSLSALFVRRLDEPEVHEVPGSAASCCPFFSEDGRLHFARFSGGLSRVPAPGGAPVTIPAPAGLISFAPRGEEAAVTTADGSLIWMRADGSLDTISPPDGGAPIVVWDLFPDGRVLATVGFTGPLVAVARGGGRDTLVNAVVAGARYADGHLIWVEQSGVLSGARLDRAERRIVGQPLQIDPSVRIVPGGTPSFAASRNGMVALVNAQPAALVRVDRSGRAGLLTPQLRRYHSPRVSPDGRTIAVDITESASRDVWLLDRRDSAFTRLSFEPGGHDPMWTRDGRSIVFAADRGGAPGIFRRNADGSGAADSILILANQITAHSEGAPGTVLAAVIGTVSDIVSVRLTGANRMPTTVLGTPYSEGFPALSPDRRLLAYVSDESGRGEVYVRPFAGGPRVIVSQNGGTEPVWSPDGRELYYRAVAGEPALVAASIVTAPSLRVTARRTLFALGNYEGAAPHPNFDVFPDNSGFVMVRTGRAAEIVIIQNWFELLRRQAAAR